MTVGGRLRAGLALALVASSALVLGPGPDRAAADTSPGTYIGPGYSDQPEADHAPEPGLPTNQPAPSAAPSTAPGAPSATGALEPLPVPPPVSPTRAENQNKLWFHAAAWWALMLDPTGRTVRVCELMPDHTWRQTPAVINTDTGDIGDALQDGDTVHVLNRSQDGSLFYVRLTFDPAAGEYQVAAPVTLTTRGSQSPATIVRDGTGRLWVAYATADNVILTYSDTGGASWTKLTILEKTGTGTTPEAAALVHYDDRVGVMWSNQATGSFVFASHHDGDAADFWQREDVISGPLMADNHISMIRLPGQPSDTLVAAVKTSQGDQDGAPDAPLIELLVRTPDGTWTAQTAGTVGDQLDDPVLQFDETNRTLYLFASGHGDIVEKHTPIDHIQMSPGPGEVFVAGAGGTLIDPTVTQEPVNGGTGIVVLASDTVSRTYRHAEVPIASPQPVVDPEDHTPPSSPVGLRARALDSDTVLLAWDAAIDGDHWAPAGQGVPVRNYVLLRDGVEVANVASTSARDEPRKGSAADANLLVHYQVVAVDDAGNRSAPAAAQVDLPGSDRSQLTRRVGEGLLVLAALAGLLYAVRYRRLTRTMRLPEKPSAKQAGTPELTTSGRRR
jgi:hypothetical protein